MLQVFYVLPQTCNVAVPVFNYYVGGGEKFLRLLQKFPLQLEAEKFMVSILLL